MMRNANSRTDVGSSTGITISNSVVKNQDDCLAVNSGKFSSTNRHIISEQRLTRSKAKILSFLAILVQAVMVFQSAPSVAVLTTQ